MEDDFLLVGLLVGHHRHLGQRAREPDERGPGAVGEDLGTRLQQRGTDGVGAAEDAGVSGRQAEHDVVARQRLGLGAQSLVPVELGGEGDDVHAPGFTIG